MLDIADAPVLSPAPLLSLFVACCNERENIVGTLNTVRDACKEVGISYELIIIDDASIDRSVEVVQVWMQDNPGVSAQLIRNAVNQGLANNFIAAARVAKGKWYRLICGDDVEPKEALVSIFRNVGRAEVLLPYHVRCRGKAWTRKLISWCYTAIVNVLSGYRIRYYNGLPVARRKYVTSLCCSQLGFGFQADFATQLLDLGLSWLEVGVPTRERTSGATKALTIKNFLGVSLLFRRLIERRTKRIMGRAKQCQLNREVMENLPEI